MSNFSIFSISLSISFFRVKGTGYGLDLIGETDVTIMSCSTKSVVPGTSIKHQEIHI